MRRVCNTPFINSIKRKYSRLVTEIIHTNKTTSNKKFSNFCKIFTLNILIQLTGTLMQSVVSLVAIVIYVISTYYDEDSINDPNNLIILNRLNSIELIIAFMISFFYFTHFFLSTNKLAYITNYLNILDVITVVPVFIKFFFDFYFNLGFTRVFRLFRLAQTMKFVRIFIIFFKRNMRSNYNQGHNIKIMSAVVSILCFVFFSAGLLNFLNKFEDFNLFFPFTSKIKCGNDSDFNETWLNISRSSINKSHDCQDNNLIYEIQEFNFDTAFYYLIITITTVGYGDGFPISTFGRLVTGYLLIIALIYISVQSGLLGDLVKENPYIDIPYKPDKKYIILTGFFNKNSLKKFLEGIFSNQIKSLNKHIKIIIIRSKPLGSEMEAIINNPSYDNKIFFILGKATDEVVISTTRMINCRAVFIVSDNSSDNMEGNDYSICLKSNIYSNYTNAPIYIQFAHAKCLSHNFIVYDHAFSIKQLKNNIIQKNGFIHGIATIILNLISSSAIISNQEINEINWFAEYTAGLVQKIHFLKIKDDYVGRYFKEVVIEKYLSLNSLIIGVKHRYFYKNDLRSKICKSFITINPVNYKLEPDDEFIVLSNIEGLEDVFYSQEQASNLNFYKENTSNIDIVHLLRDEIMHLESIALSNNIKSFINSGMVNSNFRLKKKNSFDEISQELKRTKTILKIELKNVNHYNIWEKKWKKIENLFKSHFLIISPEKELYDFIPLFSKNTSETILYLSIFPPSGKWSSFSSAYSNLFYIQMKNMDIDEFKKLKVNLSCHIYFLSNKSSSSLNQDSHFLTIVKVLEENFKDIKMTVEFTEEINYKFYSNNNGITSKKSSNSIIFEEKMNVPFRLTPKYSKSEVFFTSYLDSLLPYTFFYPYTIEVLHRLLNIEQTKYHDDIIENRELSLFKYMGKSDILFGKIAYILFNLPEQVIPLAIYRTNKLGNLKNTHPYVVTNPNPNSYLTKGDEIICIGKTSFFQDVIVDEFHRENDTIFSESEEEDLKLFNRSQFENNEEDKFMDLSDEDFFQNFTKELKEMREMAGENLEFKENVELFFKMVEENKFIDEGSSILLSTLRNIKKNYTINNKLINLHSKTLRQNLIQQKTFRNEEIEGREFNTYNRRTKSLSYRKEPDFKIRKFIDRKESHRNHVVLNVDNEKFSFRKERSVDFIGFTKR